MSLANDQMAGLSALVAAVGRPYRPIMEAQSAAHGVLRLGYVHARVTDFSDAKSHYGNTMGLYPMHEEPGKIYYKGWDEWDHHSVVLEEGGVGLIKLGFKVSDPAEIDGIEQRAGEFGCVTERMSAGETLEVSDGMAPGPSRPC